MLGFQRLVKGLNVKPKRIQERFEWVGQQEDGQDLPLAPSQDRAR